jgi:hypothetical protein
VAETELSMLERYGGYADEKDEEEEEELLTLGPSPSPSPSRKACSAAMAAMQIRTHQSRNPK